MATIPQTIAIVRNAIDGDVWSIIIQYFAGSQNPLSCVTAITYGVYEHVAGMLSFTERHVRLACEFHQSEIAELIITRVKKDDAKDKKKILLFANNGLCAAALAGDTKLVEYMIRAGANYFHTALMFAWCGELKEPRILQILHDRGARLRRYENDIIAKISAGEETINTLWDFVI